MSEQTAVTEETLHRLVDPPSGRIERWISWFADQSSPVLVKEVRQALKSRSFLLTYMLLLLAALIWSVLGMSIALTEGIPDAGGVMLVGYLWILGFPLSIVVPLTAYRSLCREFEEDTLHLVSITTMSPRKLIIGKLISALAQMVIYLSALAPCIAFTWLLRGLDVFQILFALVLAVIGSASLSAAGLFLASISRNPVFRIVVLVGMIVGLGFVYVMWCAFRVAIQEGELDTFSIAFQIHLFCIFAMGTSGYLLLEAAASTISFPADNRSTPIRIAMMVQTVAMMALGTGMVAFNGLGMSDSASEIGMAVIMFSMCACMYWMIMGSALAGESPVLSARVRRSMPRTIVGKTFFAMLMPGGGRGYLFAFGNMLGWTLAALVIALATGHDFLFDSLQVGKGMREGPDFGFALLGLVYGVFYLNLVYFSILVLGRLSVRVNPVLGLVLLLAIFVLVNLGSWTAHLLYHIAIGSAYVDDFSVFLIPNIFVGFQQFVDSGLGFGQFEGFAIFGITTCLMTFFAFIFASRELVDRPASIPQRVLDELKKAKKAREERGESIEDIFAERLGETLGESTIAQSDFNNPPVN